MSVSSATGCQYSISSLIESVRLGSKIALKNTKELTIASCSDSVTVKWWLVSWGVRGTGLWGLGGLGCVGLRTCKVSIHLAVAKRCIGA